MSESHWEEMVTVGRIVRPHGRHGAVVVAPETDFGAERFKPGSVLQWRRAGTIGPVGVVTSREYRGRWVVTFEGVATMDDAEALRDLELKVGADERRPLVEGQHYVHDLEGCEVIAIDGSTVGRVGRVDIGPFAAILVVTDDQGGEVLVPLVETICREIDPAGRRIVIDPPAGLLDLNRRGG
jgi:16S rRNA processing protein RimM